MTSDSNIFKLFRDPKIISQLLFEKTNSLEFKELTSDNANGKYVLHYFFYWQEFISKKSIEFIYALPVSKDTIFNMRNQSL